MKHTWKTRVALMLCAAVLLSVAGLSALAQEGYAVGNEVAGFIVKERTRLELVNADVTVLEHGKTGATVMLMANEDNNRAFDISFRTPVVNDTGLPHVFEHATLGGSMKYPSQSLFFNLIHQTYNTFMNAMTTDIITTYPVSSLSEKQLLKYVDYYVDSAFNPLLMQEESIFREEAWRYAMADKDAPLTLVGTVYTEMQGAYSIETASMFNFKKTMFPGSETGNSYGGHPAHIPQMTWQDLKDYHDDYYHPSNSLTLLYGKIEDLPAFLTLLDGYFSAYDKKEFAFEDAGYQPLTAPVKQQFDFAVEAGSDTAKGAVVYYGFALTDATAEDEAALDLLTTLLNEASSPFQQAMKKQLPSANAGCYFDNATPEVSVVFRATGLSAEDAPLFQKIVDESLAGVQDNGFDLTAVEAVAAATRLALLLSTESASVGTDVAPSIAYLWAATGDTGAYSRYVDNTANYVPFAEQGVYQQVIAKHLTGNPRTALVVTAPVPGLKEQQAQQLAEELAAKKAQMTAEEIDAIVASTAASGAQKEDDSSQLVASLQAVTVDTLPEERRIYAIADEVGADQVRRMDAQADVGGVGQALLLLDAGAVAQEDLHWYKLYIDLLGKLDTAQHDNAELSALMTRYLYRSEVRPTVYGGPQGDQCNPYLRVSWIAMDEDMAPAYDLVYELLYETKLDDAGKVADVLSQAKAALKQTITNGIYQIQVYRAFASSSPSFAYFNYLNHLDYYAFLEQAEALLASDPQAALDKLAGIQQHMHVRNGAVSAFAGSEESALSHRQAADAFLARLEDQARDKAAYQLPEVAHREGFVVDSAVQYNLVYAPYQQLGLEGTSGALDALSGLVADAFLYPKLRDQYGAYSVQHVATEDGVFILSYRDPNVKETFDVYAALPEMLDSLALEQDGLNGYILSAYSNYALSQGELSGALSALVSTIDGKPQERYLTWMRELKGLTVEGVKAYADMYRALSEKGYRSTAGGAAAIEQNKDLFDKTYNPFSVKDTSGDVLSDVVEGSPYYEAVRFVYEGKAMAPIGEGVFGVDEPATLGDLVGAVMGLAGIPGTAEEGVPMLAQAGILAADDRADTPLTREKLADTMATFLAVAAGMDTKAALAPLDDIADQAEISPASVGNMQFMLTKGLLLAEDGMLHPQAPATRAEVAYAIFVLNNME
ncbi:MAG: hypothetical protein GX653_02630 [Clostridiales bacterium]|nr:hypothetical protein [Clostridiales bacterium]